MKPVTVSVTVPQPVEEVYDFLDVLANHEAFLDHFLVDWKFSGSPRGVGAKAEARASAPMSQDWTEFEVVEAERPGRIVEEGVGARREAPDPRHLPARAAAQRRDRDLLRAGLDRGGPGRKPDPADDPRLPQAVERQGDASPRQAASRSLSSSLRRSPLQACGRAAPRGCR